MVVASGYPRFFEESNGSLRKFVGQHYSVHKRCAKNTVTITQKTELGNFVRGIEFDNSTNVSNNEKLENLSNKCVVECGDEAFVAPVFARRLPRMGDEVKNLNIKNKDVGLCVGRFSANKAIICFSVFACDSDFYYPEHKDDRFQRIIVSFEIYSLIVYIGYLNIPVLDAGDVIAFRTYSEVRNGNFQDRHEDPSINTLDAADLQQVNADVMGVLLEKTRRRLDDFLRGGGGEPAVDPLILPIILQGLAFTAEPRFS